jgi:AcrR family transcriptional regulator
VDLPLARSGKPRVERADAVRNRQHLLRVAREIIAEQGVEKVTMDGLAEQSGLGKGTVFRRFGTRAGIFQALLNDAEQTFQQAAMSGPPPLGPGADPVQRLIAYGRARIVFLLDHFLIARASLGRNQPVPTENSFTRQHLHMLLTEARHRGQLDIPDLDSLAMQLTAAMEAPFLLYLTTADLDPAPSLAASWQVVIERLTQTPITHP